ncbi:MAG: oxidoreductase [Planctomyces sp.]|nr:oxidoreductase [Planctomyces sp.]
MNGRNQFGCAVIIGASSGIGAELARQLAARGYRLGLAARRVDKLQELSGQFSTETVVCQLDVSQPERAQTALRELIEQLGDVDLFVLSAGTGHENPEFDWALEADTLQVNVLGFAAVANVATHYLEQRGAGMLVGLSSIAAVRGNGAAPAYGASKAFVSHYLKALRHRFAKAGRAIHVLDVQPGFVDTAMAKGEGLFWVAPVDKAARQILHAIDRKRKHVYVTKRWRLIACLLRLLPDWLYHKM